MVIINSPFRYPGGKGKLKKFVNELLKNNNLENSIYIEPFSGGFGIGINLLMNNIVSKVVINDYDKAIYSVWYSILNHTDKLISLINETPITIDEWYKQKDIYTEQKNHRNSLELGFATLFLNRTNRSGIISAGPIGGKTQNGDYKINCRFNKEKLIEIVGAIAEQKHRIELYQKDALSLIDMIKEKYDAQNTFIFFDPPYYVQGKNLYKNFYVHKDHEKLAKKIVNVLSEYNWIVTYDYAEQIHDIYNNFDIQKFSYELNYSAQTIKKATEYMFGNSKIDFSNLENILLVSD